MQLQLIREIEDFSFARQDEYENTLCKWRQQDVTNFNEFEYIEPILAQRTTMLQINDTLTNNANIKNALFNTYLQISKIAADKENLHIATRSLGTHDILYIHAMKLLFNNYKDVFFHLKFFYDSCLGETNRSTIENSRSITLSRISVSKAEE